jgi:hypothetical protein
MSEKPKPSVPSVPDPSVLRAARDAAQIFSTVDPKTVSMAHDAARDMARVTSMFDAEAMKGVTDSISAITGMDTGAVASVARGIAGFDTSKFVASGAITEFARAFEDARPVVAPQIAAALGAVDTHTRPYASAAEAVKNIGALPAFKFAKSIDSTALASVMSGGISDSIKNLDLSEILGSNFANSTSAFPSTVPPSFIASFEEATREAVAMAETEAIADPVDESIAESVGWIDGLTPARRRKLISEALYAIAALLAIAGWLSGSDETAAAGLFLGAAVTLIRLYWALVDKDA